MMERKFTDKDIIKALNRCCAFADCRGCPFQVGGDCIRRLCKESLELINRQNAKIKALQMDNEQLQSDIANANMNLDHAQTEIEGMKHNLEIIKKKKKTAKAEAIKEFAERLKATPLQFRVDRTTHYYKPPVSKMVLFVDDSDINDILQELTEGDK